MGRGAHAIMVGLGAMLLGLLMGCVARPTPLSPKALLPPAEWEDVISTSRLSAAFSPDGRWIASTWVIEETSPIRIYSALDRSTVFTASLPLGDVAAVLESWAPDGSAVAFATLEQICQGCPYSHILILEPAEPRRPMSMYLYEIPPGNYNYHIDVQWSPLSDRLAVLIDWQRLIILDRQAVFRAETNAARCGADNILDIEMTEKGVLYLITGPLVPSRVEASELHYDLVAVTGERLDRCRRLYRSPERLEILAYAPQEHLLLLALPGEEEDTTRLQVFDPTHGQVRESIALGAKVNDVSSFGPWTAMEVYGEQEGIHLMVFDWRDFHFADQGEIVGLVGWRGNVDGFLVIKGNPLEESTWYFDVMRP